MWIARDKDGGLFLYDTLPIEREDYFECRRGYDCYHLDSKLFPEVTFEESPQKVELRLVELKLVNHGNT